MINYATAPTRQGIFAHFALTRNAIAISSQIRGPGSDRQPRPCCLAVILARPDQSQRSDGKPQLLASRRLSRSFIGDSLMGS